MNSENKPESVYPPIERPHWANIVAILIDSMPGSISWLWRKIDAFCKSIDVGTNSTWQ